jgi:predicted esterase
MSRYGNRAASLPCERWRFAIRDRHCVVGLAVGGVMIALIAGLQPRQSFAEQPSGAATASAEPAGTVSASGKPAITRADLAAAYLRLEQAFFARPLPPDEIARINKSFDQATRAFFLGSNSEAIRTIDVLTESLAPKDQSPERAMVSLKVTVEPAVWPTAPPKHVVYRVTSIYDWSSDDAMTCTLRLRLIGPKGNVVQEHPFAVVLGKDRAVDVREPLEITENLLEPGLYQIELVSDDRGLVAGRVQVIDGPSLDQQRMTNDDRLGQLNSSGGELSQALATCRARNQLLSDRPSEENSAQFLADLNALAAEVASEISELESGVNPYINRLGDYWRVLEIGKRRIPLRLYVPKFAAGETPAPLLVVLHGMGGDENMFFEAYGAGIVKRIADEKRLMVASPLTYNFGSEIKNLHALIDSLGLDYSIDRDRIYLLGHSMGAGAAAGLACGHSDTVAAACCIAGGRFQATPNSAPLLIVSPELDGVVAPTRLQDSARKAISEGMPGELKIMPGYGHTLAVGAILPEAIDWLLCRRRTKSP